MTICKFVLHLNPISIMKNPIKISFVITLLCSFEAVAQMPNPVDMVFFPRQNRFAVSGVGGGNLYELSAAKSSTSGQIALDWNIALNSDNTDEYSYDYDAKPKSVKTLTTMFKYNPFSQANYVTTDSIETRKLAFVDNEFQIMLGLRYGSLKSTKSDQSAKMLFSPFMDFTMSTYKLDKSSHNNSGFRNFSINLGTQLGFVTNTDFGIVGIILDPQLNFISLYDEIEGGTSFEELAHVNATTKTLSRNIMGAGLKIVIPLNDFSFFIEGRKYFPLDNDIPIPGLTDRMVFSFGGMATGTAFRNKQDAQ